MSLRFLHLADIHLDGFVKGQEFVESSYISEYIKSSLLQSFENAIQYAIREQLDFIIIAGDFFHGSYRSVATYHKLIALLQELAENNIPLYVVFGNHDFIKSQPISFPFPENVKIFGEKIEEMKFDKEDFPEVSLIGFSYYKRHLTDNVAQSYPIQNDDKITIGILHGSAMQSKEHDQYAPFAIEDLLEKNYQYWALGHIHKRQILHENPYIIYPGNIQGRHHKENGEKGGYVVEITEDKHVTVNFVPFNEVVWKKVEWDASHIDHMKSLIDFLHDKKEEERAHGKNVILSLKITVPSSLVSYDELIECLSIVNEEEYETPFVLISTDVSMANFHEDAWNDLQTSLPFFHSIEKSIEDTDVVELASPFLKHPFLRQEIQAILEEKEEEWKKSARQKMLQVLLSEGEVN